MVGIPWRPSGLNSALNTARALVGSLTRELRSCKPHEKTKEKKGEEKETNYDWPFKLEVTLYDDN